MFKVALGLPVGATMMMLGQTEVAASAFPYAELALQGGALAILAWAVWHAYQTVIPGLRAEIQEDRKSYTESLRETNAGFQKTLDVMSDRHERAQLAAADRFERWETTRHVDSERLEEALKGLAINCAAARHEIKGKAGS